MNIFLYTLPEKIRYFCSSLLSRVINGNKDLRSIPFKRILCIKLDEIGDLCYSLHVFEMLGKQYPDAHLTLLCRPFAVSLTEHDPNINRVITSHSQLEGNYDLVIDLRGNWNSMAHAISIWPKCRLDRGTVRWANRKAGKHPHEVLTNLQIVEPLISSENQSTTPRIYFSQADLAKAGTFISDNRLGKFAVLHTGARKVLRRWNKFEMLATYLKKEKGLNIVFTGDSGDIPEITSIMSRIPFPTFSIAGSFNLVEFAALVSKASIYIGNESGPLHIAAVTGIPVIGLYGPGEPFVFYPWGERSAYVHHVLECNPCDQVHCVHPDNPCIMRITVDEVAQNVDKLLA